VKFPVDWRTYETFYELKKFNNYWSETEKLLANSFSDELRSAGDDGPEIQLAGTREQVMQRLFRYSTVTLLFSIVENRLADFANTMGREKVVQNLTYRDLAGMSVVEKVKQFANKVCGFDMTKAAEYGVVCSDLRKIRNAIVHRYGEAKLNELELGSTYPGIDSMTNVLEIEAEFIEFMAVKVDAFFTSLYNLAGWKVY
jgi:hypothetical protein